MIENAKNKYIEIRNKMMALNYALTIVNWDSETEAPSDCFDERSEKVGVLSDMIYSLMFDKEYIEAVNELYNSKEELDPILKREIEKTKKSLDKTLKVPQELLVKMSIVQTKAMPIWVDAKKASDFSIFSPVLKEILSLTKEMIKYLETENQKGYNVLLDDYEEGMTVEKYDKFFNLLKEELVPLIKEITKKGYCYDDSFNKLFYPVIKQKEFAKYIMEVMCFDQTRGLTKESEHPFTSGTGMHDVRVTNHYYTDNFTSSIFSMIHELGHATFDQQVDKSLEGTILSSCSAMGLHESQSRFYENIIGRSKMFWETHYPHLQKLFEENLHNVSLDQFYHFINKAECSLVRTEADELTYPLHIMIRYDIEQQLINGDLSVDELPAAWNKAYKDYLGVDVPNDKMGVLQDIHWAGGSFGYFPTYALGSAYSAQFYHQMEKEIDVKKILVSGNLKGINEWLKEHVHKYGDFKCPLDVLKLATNEDFNPKYYIEYLTNKYKKLYNI